MLNNPMDVLTQYPVRKSKKQKASFREAVCGYAQRLGYPVQVESGSFGSRNVVIGDAEKAKYLVTAHYDTCASLLFPNYLTPCSLSGFLLCQLMQFLFIAVVSVLLAFFECMLIAGVAALFGSDLGDGWILFVGLVVPGLIWINVVFTVLWMIFGLANKSNANDNTSGVVTLLEIAATIPLNQRYKVCFVLFDLEEKGLWGSRSYRKKHREATDNQMILNLDCVGDGDYIRMIPTARLKKDRKKLTSLYKACGYMGNKSILVHEKGYARYPSDQRHFPYGVGICALRKNKFCYYLGRIHTKQDTILDEINVNILRAALTTFICCDS